MEPYGYKTKLNTINDICLDLDEVDNFQADIGTVEQILEYISYLTDEQAYNVETYINRRENNVCMSDEWNYFKCSLVYKSVFYLSSHAQNILEKLQEKFKVNN